ncbi:MAG: DUF4328 domain-containing protein [Planctomycetaceae bacterium]|jgi:hypothetical protein|nr:DUF4328 domain-containing protein [Planctomycetaceae bacterium]
MADWFYLINGQQQAPVSEETIHALIQHRTLGANDVLWQEGMPDWIRISDSEFAALLPAQKPTVRRYSLQDYRNPLTLTILVSLFIGIFVLFLGIAISGYLEQRAVLTNIQNNVYETEEAKQEAVAENDALIGLIEIFRYVVGFPFSIIWYFWIYRSVKNAHAISAVPLRFGPGWAVAYWFIPILNFFRPYQALADAFRVTEKPENWKWAKFPAIVGWWWGLSLGIGILLGLLWVVQGQQIRAAGQPTIDVLLSKNLLVLACDSSASILACLLFFIVLSLYRKEQNTYFRLLSSPIKLEDIPPDPEGFDKGNFFIPSSATSGWAIAAEYASLFAICPLFAPFALILGIVALRDVKKRQLAGRGRAIFCIVVGTIFTLLLAFGLLVIIMYARGTGV